MTDLTFVDISGIVFCLVFALLLVAWFGDINDN